MDWGSVPQWILVITFTGFIYLIFRLINLLRIVNQNVIDEANGRSRLYKAINQLEETFREIIKTLPKEF